jgi:hypothetical protein
LVLGRVLIVLLVNVVLVCGLVGWVLKVAVILFFNRT